jgi:hypothetical protein
MNENANALMLPAPCPDKMNATILVGKMAERVDKHTKDFRQRDIEKGEQ